jgi:uncharacterized membrane protein
MERARRLEKIALLSLILIAAALRFYRLGAQDLWGDEAFSISLSQQPLSVVIAGASDTHPPFYPLLLFFWLKLVGAPMASAGAFATRALSAFIGILVVPLIFVLARGITTRASRRMPAADAPSAAGLLPSQARVPWFAVVLATVSPLLIYYSQETRMYELVAVLALASSCWLVKIVALADGSRGAEQQRGNGSPLLPRAPVPLQNNQTVGFFVATLLALYTHYSAFFVLAAENVFASVRLRKNRAALVRWLWLQGALVVAYVPWILAQTAFLGGKASARFDEWGWRGVEMIFGKTLLAFSAGLTVEFPVAHIAAALSLTFAALGGVAIAESRFLDARASRREKTGFSDRLFAPLYFIVPVALAYVVNPVMPFFFERYVLVALPGFILTVAFGLDNVAQRDARAAIGVTGVLVLVSAFSLGNYYFDDAYAKGKYGQMMAYVSQNAQPGDALVLNNPLQKPLYNYYAPRGVPAFFLPDGAPLEDPRARQQLEEIARQHARLWLVMFGNPAEYDPTGYLERWLGAHAFKTYFNGFVDASLSLYAMPGAQPVIQRQLRATLGESIQLVGYALDRAEALPGQTLQLTLHWKTHMPITNRYTVFAHVIGAPNPATQSPVWAQMDNEPVGGSRPTTTWQVGETIDDRYGLRLPQDTPPGEYLIEIGMYDPATLARLPVRDETGARVAEDRVLLGTVRVLAR